MDVLQSFSREEIERMRALVQAHDNQSGRVVNEFDLAKPPVPPYRHQEFPRLMYNHAKRSTRLAHDEEQVQAALEAGWRKEPFPAEVEETELDAETISEAAAIDKQLKKKKRD